MTPTDPAVKSQRSRLVESSRNRLLERFDRAAAALPAYVDALGMEVVRPLFGAPSSPNILREVRDATGRRAVLKLIGSDARGEVATLEAWTTAGVPCPLLLHAGYGRYVEGVTHLLLDWVDGDPLPHREMPGATSEAVALFGRGHLPPPAGTTPLAQFLQRRFETSLTACRLAGLPVMSTMERALDAAVDRAVLLHGDAVGFNLLHRSGDLVMLDPAGVQGPREHDAATWVARALVVPGPAALPELIETALAADRSLDKATFHHWLGVELIIEAGYRLRTPDVMASIGADVDSFDEDTYRYAELAAAIHDT